ncbi:MAG TPA: glycogen debranching protein GlgX [Chloroflexota bacterium]|nr:glycogen debranching protein GlgX [Chloroflexota bacterium]
MFTHPSSSNYSLQVQRGKPFPLGPTADAGGFNFSVFSEEATLVELLLFERPGDLEPSRTITLDPDKHKTFHFWHVYLAGLRHGTQFAFRVHGPWDPDAGHRFDSGKLLLDPYARGIDQRLWRRDDAGQPGDNLASSMRSIAIDAADYDWEGDTPPGHSLDSTVIYELHVGGFTKSPSSGVQFPGTYRGLVEKIPYLKALGVSAVELLPVFDFDAMTTRQYNGKPLRNYWGYSPLSFFAPHGGYCVEPSAGTHVREFRDLVKALHRAGIEVILDVVYNHTDEGNDEGPTFCLRGLANAAYYYLKPGAPRYYEDFSGCGNTVKCNHPITAKLILDSLRYWVREMHVDGFRFDEASILSRGEDGKPIRFPPVIWAIELDDDLSATKVFAEAWDAAGLYEVGSFPGYRWSEWNGKFRDDVRRYVRGDPGLVRAVAARLSGSPDLYQGDGRLPSNSLNFVTAHDGFTLNDLVSYNAKHNEANGESNHDGSDENFSWNCGVEGPSDDAEVEALRERQIRNLATLLLLSQGIPMISMGDEARRTQGGNNNAYCQDNETSWFDWSLPEKHARLLRFWRRLIEFRRSHTVLRRSTFFSNAVNERGIQDVEWHGTRLHDPGWGDPSAHALAFTLGSFDGGADLHVMMNMWTDALDFEIRPSSGRQWYRALDTSLTSPDDIADPGAEPLVSTPTYHVSARGIAVLISKPVER